MDSEESPIECSQDTLQAALYLAEHGYKVFPLYEPNGPATDTDPAACSCGNRSCSSIGKHPRVAGWKEVATTDETQIKAWWERWPTANIGISTEGLLVLDLDGPLAFQAFLEEHNVPMPPVTVASRTGKGLHMLFQRREGEEIGNLVGVLPGCDIRTEGGYIVAPGSLHATGKRYAWYKPDSSGPAFSPENVPLAPLPQNLLNLILEAKVKKQGLTKEAQTHPQVQEPSSPTVSTPVTDPRKSAPSNNSILPIYSPSNPSPYAQAALRSECDKVSGALPGTRNDILNDAAYSMGQLIAGGELDQTVVESDLTTAALSCGLNRKEIRATIRSGIRGGMKQPRNTPPPITCGTIHFNHKGEAVDPQTGEVLADQLKSQGQGRANGKQGQSQTDKLLMLVGDVEFFLDTATRTHYACYTIDGVRQTHPVRSRGLRELLTYRFYKNIGTAPSAQAMEDTLRTLESRAAFDGNPPRQVGFRTLRHSDAIYIDLCNDRWEVVKVTAEGWEIVANPPVHFRRSERQAALPTPVRGGDLRDILNYININPEDYPLLAGYLVSALNPDIEYAILTLQGEQGSGKSTTSKYIRRLTDPLTTSGIRPEPKDYRDLGVATKNSYMLVFDNLSRIPDWLSDALCRITHGGEYGTKKNYTDDEEMTFEHRRPVIINGITELGRRADLLERMLTLNTPHINPTTRRSSQEIEMEFEAARPALFGALLNAMSTAMRPDRQAQAKKLLAGKNPRMAAFALWVTAAEPALGLKEGAFISVYADQQEDNRALALESLPIATTLPAWFEARQYRPWTGSSEELLKELEKHKVEEMRVTDQWARFEPSRFSGWPTNGIQLSSHLRRAKEGLETQEGITVEMGMNCNGKRRQIVITQAKGKQSPVPPAFLEAFRPATKLQAS